MPRLHPRSVLVPLALLSIHCAEPVDGSTRSLDVGDAIVAESDGSYRVRGSFWPMVDEEQPGGPATRQGLLEVEGGPAVMLRFAQSVVIDRGAELTVHVRPSDEKPLEVIDLLDLGPPSETARARLAADEASAARIRAADADAAAHEKHHVPPGGVPTLLPPITMLVIPYHCSTAGPLPTGTPTQAQIQAFAQNTVSSWMKQASFLHRTYTVTTVPWTDVCAVPQPYPSPLDRQMPEDAALQQHNVQSNLYDRVIMLTTGGTNGFQGMVEHIPGRRAVMENLENGFHLGTWVHELAHLEGMFHANGLRCSAPPSIYGATSTCVGHERGDPADPMGAAMQMTWAAQFNAAAMHRIGWMDTATVHTMLTPGAVVIDVMTAPLAARPRAVRIPLASGTYYVEARAAMGIDTNLGGSTALNGVLVHVVSPRVDPPGGNVPIQPTQLLSPYLLDGLPTSNGPGGNAFDALPFGQDLVTPEGAVIRAAYVSPTQVRVEFKFTDLPRLTQPRNVTSSVSPTTGLVTLSWLPPELVPGSPVSYDILHVTSGTVVGTTTSTTYTSSVSAPDGLTALAVRARAGVFTTYGVGAPLFWSYPMPAVSPTAIVLPEGQSASATFTLPFLPSGPVTRVGGPSPDPLISTTDYVSAMGALAFTSLTQTAGFTAVADGLTGEPAETFTYTLLENRCYPLLQVPGCLVPRPYVAVTIPAN